jgi:hypothetical protein
MQNPRDERAGVSRLGYDIVKPRVDCVSALVGGGSLGTDADEHTVPEPRLCTHPRRQHAHRFHLTQHDYYYFIPSHHLVVGPFPSFDDEEPSALKRLTVRSFPTIAVDDENRTLLHCFTPFRTQCSWFRNRRARKSGSTRFCWVLLGSAWFY